MTAKKNKTAFFVPMLLPGMNDIVAYSKIRKGNWSAYADLKAKIERDLCLFIREQRIGKFIVPIWLRFVWYEKNRRRDPDNICAGGRKFILDSLVTEGVIKNDGWKQIAGWRDSFEVSPQKPGVYVSIEEAKT